jgi:hypothetical protein
VAGVEDLAELEYALSIINAQTKVR